MDAPILKHVPPPGAGPIWLIAGTGEGPPLAQALLARGWSLQVSVVSRAAALAYPPRPGLAVTTGPIGGSPGDGCIEADIEAGVERQLERAHRDGAPHPLVIDATHPFAVRITAALAAVCRRRGQPLLRLVRPPLPCGGAKILPALPALAAQDTPGLRLLLAIGARQLREAVAHSPAAVHHARVLPAPAALRQAMAAGLAPGRVACLRPGATAAVERALCLRWGIEAVLCRRSGGATEALWRDLARELGLALLLLERPPEPRGVDCRSLEELLACLEGPDGAAARVGAASPAAPP